MKYTVSIQDYAFEDEWLDLATFRWNGDAADFAKHVSQRDRWGRDVKITGSPHYANGIYRKGERVVNV
jgi:hypothetical protein